MSDDEWLAAVDRYRDDRTTWDDSGRPRGGARELANQLAARAAEEPARFAALASRLPDGANPQYGAALLRGLTQGSLSPVQLERLLGWAHAVPDRPLGREVVDLAKANAQTPWSDESLQVVSWYATDSPDPDQRIWNSGGTLGERVWTTGVNSVRGSAAECLGVLVEVHPSRLATLLPAIRSVVSDPAASVRACAAVACTGVLCSDADLALELTQRLVEAGDVALAAPPAERLLWHLGHIHPAQVLAVLEGLVDSGIPEVTTIGARQAAVIGLSHAAAGPLVERCMKGDAASRKGVASVLATNVDKAAFRSMCETALVTLFHDEDRDVRHAAADVFRGPDGARVDDLRDLAAALVESPAFTDDMDSLLLKLGAATTSFADIIVRAAERFLDAHGDNAGDMQTGAAFTAHLLLPLVMRAYVQTTPGTELRRRCLDAIDRMYLHGIREMDAVVELAR